MLTCYDYVKRLIERTTGTLMLLSPHVQSTAHETMEKFAVPGLAILAVRGNANDPESLYFGADAAGNPVARDSLFIVASITKLATALTVLRLVDAGVMTLDDPLSKFAPDAAAAVDGVTLRTLLCHTAGLPEDLPNGAALYGTPMDWNTLAQECLRVPLAIPPRTRVVYGNVGFGLLAIVVERVSHTAFGEALQEMVLQPLAIEAYLGQEPPRPVAQLADVRSRHVGTEIEPYNSRYYRALGLPWSGLITNAEGALSSSEPLPVCRMVF